MKRFIEKIKHFYFSNKEISIIGIICISISVSYILTYNMPDYFGIEPFYSWLNNLAISYIAALIFFIVQVYVPEERNKKKCMEVLNNNFIDLVRFIDVTILVCEKYITIKEKGVELHWNGDNEKIYFKYIKCGKSNVYNNRSYTKTEIFNLHNILKEKINQIKNSPIINYCDYDILEKISELERNKFYETLVVIIKLAGTDMGFQNFSKDIKEIRTLNNDLKKLCCIFDEYQLEEMSENDKIYADLPRKNIAQELKSIREFNINNMKQHIKKQLDEQNISLPEEMIDEMSRKAVDSQMNNK